MRTVPDDSIGETDFAETHAVWWAGVAVALLVTFAVLGGLLAVGTYLLAAAGVVEPSYWPPAVLAAILSVLLVRTAVKRGNIRYKPE